MQNSRAVVLRRSLIASVVWLTIYAGVGGPSAGASVSGSSHHRYGEQTTLDSPQCSSTTPISSGPLPLSGSISNASGPPACFTFNDVSGDTVFVDAVATSTNANPAIAVIDPDGNLLSTTGVASYGTTSNGTYTIEVSDAAAGPFNIDIEQITDPVGCTKVKPGQPAVNGDIGEPGAYLCLQMSIPDKQWLSMESVGTVPAGMATQLYGVDGSPGGFFGGTTLGGLIGSGFGIQTALVFSNRSSSTGPLSMTMGDLGVTPISGAPASEIGLMGAGFTRYEPFHVYYRTGLANPATVLVCEGRVPKNREPTCVGRIPGLADAGPRGPHVITMKGAISGHVAKMSFDLT
jgi:hypothetical protein